MGQIKGVDDLFVVRAGDAEEHAFRTEWWRAYVVRYLLQSGFKWRIFRWHEHIRNFFTLAAIDADHSLEGLMSIEVVPQQMVKVLFLATAPWNTHPNKRRERVGPALLRSAINVSKHFNAGGVLELSSTPESESFYQQEGFTWTGSLDHEGLKIFRLATAQADAFIARHKGLQPWPEEAEDDEESAE